MRVRVYEADPGDKEQTREILRRKSRKCEERAVAIVLRNCLMCMSQHSVRKNVFVYCTVI